METVFRFRFARPLSVVAFRLSTCACCGREADDAVACVTPKGVRGLPVVFATTLFRMGVMGGRPKEEKTRDMVAKTIETESVG
jgi:hypothetical protein